MFLDPNGLEILPPAACRDLMATHQIGRLGFVDGDQVSVLPVNYAIFDGQVLIRTVSGSKLAAAAAERAGALEIDDIDPRRHTGWSVLVRGQMSLVVDPDEISRIDEAGLHTWGPVGNNYVRLPMDDLTGRVRRSGPLRSNRPSPEAALRDLETTD